MLLFVTWIASLRRNKCVFFNGPITSWEPELVKMNRFCPKRRICSSLTSSWLDHLRHVTQQKKGEDRNLGQFDKNLNKMEGDE
jgi:hypothetical protein